MDTCLLSPPVDSRSAVAGVCRVGAYDRILKVARTIGTAHIAEAIQYRTLDRAR